MINTFTELIERLKNDDLERVRQAKDTACAYGVIKVWYDTLISGEYKVRDAYCKLYGVLYGLMSACCISTQEAEKLIAELDGIMKERGTC